MWTQARHADHQRTLAMLRRSAERQAAGAESDYAEVIIAAFTDFVAKAFVDSLRGMNARWLYYERRRLVRLLARRATRESLR